MNLTRDEILNATPAQLREWVALYVMEWERRWYNNDKKHGYCFWYDKKNDRPSGWLEYDVPNDWNGEVFRPDEDIAAAFSALMEMAKRWQWYELMWRPRGHICNVTGNSRDTVFDARAEVAICKAVLLAKIAEQ